MVDLDDINVITERSAAQLNERQLLDYRDQRERCLKWLLAFGKDPDKANGYAHATVKARSHRMDKFYRWVWEQEDGYTAQITHEHANEWMRQLAYEEYSNAHRDNCQKAVQMLFKWRHHQCGADIWEPEIRFSVDDSSSNPRDYLTMDERRLIREASLEYDSIPHYKSLDAERRDRWKAYLAQRLGKPKENVGKSDWREVNTSWKYPSLVFTSLDAAFRPIEVERATVGTSHRVSR